MSNIMITRLAQLAHPWREASGAEPVGPEPQAVNRRVKFLSKTGKAALAAAIALSLSACVESERPLLTDVQALAGPEIEVHFYETFVDRKASDFHISFIVGKRTNTFARHARRRMFRALLRKLFRQTTSSSRAPLRTKRFSIIGSAANFSTAST